MDREQVTSTMIRSIGYEPETQSLEIEFAKGGACYLYSEFPEDEYAAFKSADSFGKFFLARIKDRYPTTKL